MKKIIIIGGGGHAKVIISILKKINEYEIVGFTEKIEKDSILGIPFLGKDDILTDCFKNGIKNAVIGVGQYKLSKTRRKIVTQLSNIGFDFPKIISPNSIINDDVQVGKGTVIMDGVVINCGSRIGEFSIINTSSSVDHDCIIKSFTHIAPGVTLSGGVEVGDFSMLGTGTIVIQNKKINSNIMVGANSLIVKDLIDPGVYYGNPTKKIK